jgi:hypothetical protein
MLGRLSGIHAISYGFGNVFGGCQRPSVIYRNRHLFTDPPRTRAFQVLAPLLLPLSCAASSTTACTVAQCRSTTRSPVHRRSGSAIQKLRRLESAKTEKYLLQFIGLSSFREFFDKSLNFRLHRVWHPITEVVYPRVSRPATSRVYSFWCKSLVIHTLYPCTV